MDMSIKDVLKEMRAVGTDGKPKCFSIRWITLNVNKKTGGEIRELEKAICLNNVANKSRRKSTKAISPSTQKVARHRQNQTMNIKEMIGKMEYGEIIKIHPSLILTFNGKKVYLS